MLFTLFANLIARTATPPVQSVRNLAHNIELDALHSGYINGQMRAPFGQYHFARETNYHCGCLPIALYNTNLSLAEREPLSHIQYGLERQRYIGRPKGKGALATYIPVYFALRGHIVTTVYAPDCATLETLLRTHPAAILYRINTPTLKQISAHFMHAKFDGAHFRIYNRHNTAHAPSILNNLQSLYGKGLQRPMIVYCIT